MLLYLSVTQDERGALDDRRAMTPILINCDCVLASKGQQETCRNVKPLSNGIVAAVVVSISSATTYMRVMSSPERFRSVKVSVSNMSSSGISWD